MDPESPYRLMVLPHERIQKEKNIMKKRLLCLTALILSGCLGMPESMIPVKEFEI
jgi:hypothetical protein